LVKKFLVAVLFAIALPLSAQKLPPPRLHLPQPAQGSTSQAQTGGAANLLPAGSLPSLKLQAAIEPLKIYQAEFFNYLIELKWEKGKDICELEFKLPEVPKAEGVKAVGSEFESENLVKGESEQVRRIYGFRYFPEKKGKSAIAQADFEYRCRGTEPYAKISVPSFPLEILPPRFHLADLKGSRAFQASLALVLAAAIFSTAFLIWRQRRKKSALKPVMIEQTAENQALEMLKSADQFRIAGRYPDYFLALERVLKTFLEQKYAIRWSGRDRLVQDIAKAAAAELAENIDRLLILSDRVKFAGVEPSTPELDQAYRAVRGIIEFKKLEITGGVK